MQVDLQHHQQAPADNQQQDQLINVEQQHQVQQQENLMHDEQQLPDALRADPSQRREDEPASAFEERVLLDVRDREAVDQAVDSMLKQAVQDAEAVRQQEEGINEERDENANIAEHENVNADEERRGLREDDQEAIDADVLNLFNRGELNKLSSRAKDLSEKSDEV